MSPHRTNKFLEESFRFLAKFLAFSKCNLERKQHQKTKPAVPWCCLGFPLRAGWGMWSEVVHGGEEYPSDRVVASQFMFRMSTN